MPAGLRVGMRPGPGTVHAVRVDLRLPNTDGVHVYRQLR
jgi:hypothetical protein